MTWPPQLASATAKTRIPSLHYQVQTFGLGLDFRTQHGVTGKRRRPLAAWPVFEASSQPDAAAGLLDGVTRVGGGEEIDLGDD